MDKEELVRQGLIRILTDEPGVSIVTHLGSNKNILDEIVRTHATLVILDPDLGSGVKDGLLLVDRLKATNPEIGIILLTNSLTDADTLDVVRRGIDGVMSKTSPLDEILAVVRSVLSGDIALDKFHTNSVLRTLRSGVTAHTPAFTLRERDVLSLVVSGLGNKAIGAELFITEATVKYHLRNIMDKFSVRRRAEVVAIALRMGVV
ncbi:response regulator transcription factor [Rhodococcus sp. IEGM 1408]|uniref:response regulator transcription factor n=1 Tax=Rhodococcus sp. IEGM 1408 TaxID=3082220 RepID=UPI0029529FC5|nr:response regulator transcription factor [Rhodococcus sp. IEGM 1408]MDV8002989.1 response regulator transcription factor [Rhodococcus sp. IEGM 1408]